MLDLEKAPIAILKTNGIKHNMKILICDDEADFTIFLRDMLTDYCKKKGVVATFIMVTQPETLTGRALGQFDIALLDIDMQPINGIDMGHALRKARADTLIIFVTNYVEYASIGYEVQAFRYLEKSKIPEKLEEYFSSALEEFRDKHRSLTFNVDGQKISVPVRKILYIESNIRVMRLYLAKEAHTMYQFYATMAEVEEMLGANGFLRIHKSYLVNMEYLIKLQCHEAKLVGGKILPVSEQSYAAIKERFLVWRGENKWNIS